MHLAIHYNPARGFEDEALALARRLFAHFDDVIDSLALIPVLDEDLDLVLDGVVLRSLSQSGQLPRVADVPPSMSSGHQAGIRLDLTATRQEEAEEDRK
jgi:hypothetical protein